MTSEQKHELICKIWNVEDTLMHQNNGADIHAVGAMRNTAAMLLHELSQKDSKMGYLDALKMVHNLERACVEFFKKKFSHLN